MTSKILAILSPPGDDSIISQARAIQAHQPDLVILLKTYFPGRKSYATIDAAHGMDSRVHRVD